MGSSVPGTDSTSAAAAAFRDEILSPMISIASGGGPIHATPRLGDRAGEVGVLGEEPVARVHRLGAAALDRVEDGVGVEVALGRGLPAERVGLVGVADVERVTVELGVDGDRGDAELAAGAHDPNRDLAAVRDEDFAEQRGPLEVDPAIGRRILRRCPSPPAPRNWPRRWRIEHFAELDSTNRHLLEEARAGAADGLVAVADHQTAGRGRLDRTLGGAAGVVAAGVGAAPAGTRATRAALIVR